MIRSIKTGPAALGVLLVCADKAEGQPLETSGTRALGMGGAFVAVADDATATAWNPAALGVGPTFTLQADRALIERDAGTGGRRASGGTVALTTLPIGLSYSSTVRTVVRDRHVESARARQVGITLVQTLTGHIVAGATVKLLSGAVARGELGATGESMDERLDRGEALPADRKTWLDFDLGLVAFAGSARLGMLARNVRAAVDRVRAGSDRDSLFGRHVRLGIAVMPGHPASDPGAPTIFALDVDLTRTSELDGEFQMLAAGVQRRVGGRAAARAGLRINTLEAADRGFTVGGSFALRPTSLIDAHAAFGGAGRLGRGWGIGARVTF